MRTLFFTFGLLLLYCFAVPAQAQQNIPDKYSFDWREVKEFENDRDLQKRNEVKDQIEQNLAKSIRLFIAETKKVDIVAWVANANGHRGEMDETTIMALDAKWLSATDADPFIKQVSSNSCASQLKEFQSRRTEFVEIFVTDNIGLNICQTNKTSDYYQADETWWSETFNARGQSHHGPLQYDESAQTFGIAIYAPIVDPGNNKVIGVAKAVVKTRYKS